MSVFAVLAELWDRMTAVQPSPPDWVVAASGVLALVVVVNRWAWHLTRNAITIAHEGGHALASLLTGRRLDGIRLHSDTSGETRSRGKPHGPGMVAHRAGRVPHAAAAGSGRRLAAGRAPRGRAALAAAAAAVRDVPGHAERLRGGGGAGDGGGRERGDAAGLRPGAVRLRRTAPPGSCCLAGCGRWPSCGGPAAARGGPGAGRPTPTSSPG